MLKELFQFVIDAEMQNSKQLTRRFAMTEIQLPGMDAQPLVKLKQVIHVLA